MIAWAKHEFDLSKPDSQGITKREHLEQVLKATGVPPEGLENPTEYPELMEIPWNSFKELNRARQPAFSGVSPISYSEIMAWKELTHSPVRPRDIGVIKLLDAEYMKVMNG